MEECQRLEKKLLRLDFDVKIYVGKREGITPETIALARQYAITELIKFSRANMALCIFHKENSPSLQYYPKSNSTYCFGCNKHADSIDIVREQYGLTFSEAIKKLT